MREKLCKRKIISYVVIISLLVGIFQYANLWMNTGEDIAMAAGTSPDTVNLGELTSAMINSFSCNSGTTYYVDSMTGLVNLATLVNNKGNSFAGCTVELRQNVSLSGAWTPIGDSTTKFQGTFNGNNYEITGLSITAGSNIGFFGYIGAGAVVENLVIDGSVSGGQFVGGLAGYVEGTSVSRVRILNCISKCVINATQNCVACMVGISICTDYYDCEAQGNVTTSGSMSGAVFTGTANYCTFEKCDASGNITINNSDANNSYWFGGIIGETRGAGNSVTIKECSYTGDVTTTGSVTAFGGIVGTTQYSTAIISDCVVESTFSFGNATVLADIGGISGYIDETNSIISNCIVNGDINYTSKRSISNLGGIAGNLINGKIIGCCNKANIYGTSQVGGIVGYYKAGSIVTCVNIGNVNTDTAKSSVKIGGVAGYSETTSNAIVNCCNDGNVYGYQYIGGMCGSFKGYIYNSCNYGSIYGITSYSSSSISGTNGTYYIGGLVGELNTASIDSSYNIGDVSGYAGVAGIAGQTSSGKITKCFNVGRISSLITGKSGQTPGSNTSLYMTVGGIVGNDVGASSITNCYNVGETVSKGNAYHGGIAGYFKGSISNCYNDGTITDSGTKLYVAGIVGYLSSGNVSTCFETTYGYDRYRSYYLYNNSDGAYGKSSNSFDANTLGSTNWINDYNTHAGYLNSQKPLLRIEVIAINSYKDMERLSYMVMNGESHYISSYTGYTNAISLTTFLLQDVSAGSGATSTNHEPIGKNASNKYQGTINGLMNKITDIYISNTSDYQGFIGYAGDYAQIKNLEISGTISAASYVGVFIGYASANSDSSAITITNCIDNCNVQASGSYVGGIAGYSCNVKIDSVSILGTVNGSIYVGGFLGLSDNSSIINSENSGDITFTGNNSVGGFIGSATSSSITKCKMSGDIILNSGGYWGGGFVGIADTVTIDECTNTKSATINGLFQAYGGIVGECKNSLIKSCNVSADVKVTLDSTGERRIQDIAGIAGFVSGTSEETTIVDCIYSGDINTYDINSDNDVKDIYSTGGIIGSTAKNIPVEINRCINEGNISGKQDAGGIVGFPENSSTIIECVNKGNIFASTNAGGIAGESDANINLCYSYNSSTTNTISGSTYGVGGLVGTNNGTINNSYNRSTISASGDSIGGIAGSNTGTINSCYSSAALNLTSTTNAAGMVGNNTGTVNRCLYNETNTVIIANEILGINGEGSSINSGGRTDEIMKSNQAAWELNQSGSPETNSGVWSNDAENIVNDGYPIFADSTFRAVYGVNYVQPSDSLGTIEGYISGLSSIETNPDKYLYVKLGETVEIRTSAIDSYCVSKVNVKSDSSSGANVTKTMVASVTENNSSGVEYSKSVIHSFVMPTKEVYISADIVLAEDYTGDVEEDIDIDNEIESNIVKEGDYPDIKDFGTDKTKSAYILKSVEGWEELVSISPNELASKTIYQVCDIDFGGASHGIISSFKGTFNGQNFTMDNFVATGTTSVGMFATVELGAIVENVKAKVTITASGDDSGGIASLSNGTIRNCKILSGSSISGTNDAGGIVGYIKQGTICECENYGTVYGIKGVGGISGYLEVGKVTQCYNGGNVSGDESNSNSVCVAGIVGDTYGKEPGANCNYIVDCVNEGNISSYGDVGGIVGWLNEFMYVYYCSNTGKIQGKMLVGGVVGIGDIASKVIGSSNSGEVLITATSCNGTNTATTTNAGGIIGRSYGKVISCFNSGKVSGIGFIGGIAGFLWGNTGNQYSENYSGNTYSSAAIINCYNTGSMYVTSSNNSDYLCVGGITGRAVSENANVSVYVLNSYSVGDISNNVSITNTGTITGKAYSAGSVLFFENCYAKKATNTSIKTVGACGGTNIVVDGNQYSASQASTNGLGKTILNDSTDVYSGLISAYSSKLSTSINAKLAATDDNLTQSDISGWISPSDTSAYYSYETTTETINSGYPILDMPVVAVSSSDDIARLSYSVNENNNTYYFNNKEIANERSTSTPKTMPFTMPIYTWITDTISMGGTSNVNASGYNHVSIGNESTAYDGVFNGLNNNISGMCVKGNSYSYYGLFGKTGIHSIFKDVNILESDVTITALSNNPIYAGGLVGDFGGQLIDNCASAVDISYISKDTSVITYTGGIVGVNGLTEEEAQISKISNCEYSGIINGNINNGGIAGVNNGLITECSNTGTVDGEDVTAGISGINSNKIIKCNNNGTISGTNNVAGISGSNSGLVIDSDNTGAVTGINIIGGIAGTNSKNIAECYNTGLISGGSNVGGIAGYNTGTVKDYCYNSGKVLGTGSNIGGIVGVQNDIDAVTKLVYNIANDNNDSTYEITGQQYVGGIIGSNQSGYVIDCFNRASIKSTVSSGEAYVGGIAGYNSGGIYNGYSAALIDSVAGKEAANKVAGIIGYNTGTVDTSFYDSVITADISKIYTSSTTLLTDVEEKTSAELMTDDMVSKLNMYASNNRDIWIRDASGDGEEEPSLYNAGYPYFRLGTNAITKSGSAFDEGDAGATSGNEYTNIGEYMQEGITTYQVTSAADLKTLADIVNNNSNMNGITIVLANDITFSTSDINTYFTVIGSSNSNPFAGTFNGNGHTIDVSAKTTASSLFGYMISTGIIKDLKVKVNISSSNTIIGGLITNNQGKVDSCEVTGDINTTNTSTSSYTGGVVGENKGIISACKNFTLLTGKNNVGGIAGTLTTGTIMQCYNEGIIDTSSNSTNKDVCTGGIVGTTNVSASSTGLYIIDCLNIGTVNGYYHTAGIAGELNQYGYVYYCRNEGDITGNKCYAAGIAGETNKFAKVVASSNSGNVTAKGGDSYNNTWYYGDAGGIVAISYGKVISCYNTGDITAGLYAGGITSRTWAYNSSGEKSLIVNCYNTGNITLNASYRGNNTSMNVGGITALVCSQSNTDKAAVVNSYSSGSVTGGTNKGWIIGEIYISRGYIYLYKNYLIGSKGTTSYVGKINTGYGGGGYINGSQAGNFREGSTTDNDGYRVTSSYTYSTNNMSTIISNFNAQSLNSYIDQSTDAPGWIASTTYDNSNYINRGYPLLKTPVISVGNHETLEQFAYITNGTGDKHYYTSINGKEVSSITGEDGIALYTWLTPTTEKSVNNTSSSLVCTGGTTSVDNHVPIGNKSSNEIYYDGVFDGLSNSITGAFIDNTSSTKYCGLFGYMGEHAVVKDANITDTITILSASGQTYAGTVAGFSDGVIENVTANANVTDSVSGSGKETFVGGIIGENDGLILDCNANGSVSGYMNTGGIAGKQNIATAPTDNKDGYESKGTYKTCTTATVLCGAGGYAGGIIGINDSGKIRDCYNRGNVTVSGAGSYAGGIVGLNTSSGIVYTSYCTGNLNLSSYTTGTYAGIAGNNVGILDTCFYVTDKTHLPAELTTANGLGTVTSLYGVTVDEMKKNKIAWALNTFNGFYEKNSDVWSRDTQDTSNENLLVNAGYPTYSDNQYKPVYRVTYTITRATSIAIGTNSVDTDSLFKYIRVGDSVEFKLSAYNGYKISSVANATTAAGGTVNLTEASYVESENISNSGYDAGDVIYRTYSFTNNMPKIDVNVAISTQARRFRISYNLDGGTIDVNALSTYHIDKTGEELYNIYTYGQTTVLPEETSAGTYILEKDNYLFDGWYTANEGGSLITAISSTLLGNPAANISIYARWSPADYYVTIPKTVDCANAGNVEGVDFNISSVLNRIRTDYSVAVGIKSGIAIKEASVGVVPLFDTQILAGSGDFTYVIDNSYYTNFASYMDRAMQLNIFTEFNKGWINNDLRQINQASDTYKYNSCVAAFSLDHMAASRINLKMNTLPVYAGEYRGTLTFIVDYRKTDTLNVN